MPTTQDLNSEIKLAKINPTFLTKRAKNNYPLGPNIPVLLNYKGVPPQPRPTLQYPILVA